MREITRKLRKTTYYCVGWTARDPEAAVIQSVLLPRSGIMRVLDKGVHQAALESVGRKLRELDRRSGKVRKSLPYE
jgi:hypothetical protein